MNDDLKPYVPICEAIAKLFSPNVEVVLHDLVSGTIAYMANAFSKRRIGDESLTEIQALENLDLDVIGPYPKVNFNGRKLKSITTVLRNPGAAPMGLLCINYDTQTAASLIDALQKMVAIPKAEDDSLPPDLFKGDWREHANMVIDRFLKDRQVALSGLSGPDKQALVTRLDNEGIFTIRNVVPYLCDVLGVSRATLYKWLKAGRENAC